MNNLFVKETDEIIAKIYVYQDENGQLFVNENKNVILKSAKDEEGIEELVFVFRCPNFKDTVELGNEIRADEKGFNLNRRQIRYNKFMRLIKSWNLKDENGSSVDISAETVDSLHPSIAEAVCDLLEQKSGSSIF